MEINACGRARKDTKQTKQAALRFAKRKLKQNDVTHLPCRKVRSSEAYFAKRQVFLIL